MNSSLFHLLVFLWLNLIWYCLILITDVGPDKIYPKYISSSFDPTATIDFDSVLLGSINNLLSSYLPQPTDTDKLVGDWPLCSSANNTNIRDNESATNTNNISNYRNKTQNSTLTTNSTNSKYHWFVSHHKMYILKVFKSFNNFSKVSLSSISVDNFVINYKSEYQWQKSLIEEEWEMHIPGQIIKWEVSANKRILLLYYTIIKEDFKTIRLRYIDWIAEYSSDYNTEFMALFGVYTQDGTKSKSDSYFTSVYYSPWFDDLYINTNRDITAMTVDYNTIIIAYEHTEEFVIFTKNNAGDDNDNDNDNNNNKWKYFRLNERWMFEETEMKSIYFSHITALKLINSNATDFHLYKLVTQITTKGIYSKINEWEVTTFASNVQLRTKELISTQLDTAKPDSPDKIIVYNIEEVIHKLKKYWKPNLFTNNFGKTNFIFEYFNSIVCQIVFNTTELNLIKQFDEKINYISSDISGNNVWIQDKEGDLSFFYRLSDADEYSEEKKVDLKSIPKRLRSKHALTFWIEEIDSKVVLFIWIDNGVWLSLDFTKFFESLQSRGFFDVFVEEYLYSFIVIIFANILCWFMYFRKVRIGTRDLGVRNAAISQVIYQLNRINNNNNNNNNAGNVGNPGRNSNNQGQGQEQEAVADNANNWNANERANHENVNENNINEGNANEAQGQGNRNNEENRNNWNINQLGGSNENGNNIL